MIERVIVTFFLLLLSLPVLYQASNSAQNWSMPKPEIEEIKKIKPVNAKHLKCLAQGIYYEARGESMLGQVAVARVIMNRVLHGFGSNPCSVVYQATVKTNEEGEQVKMCQFSWACDDDRKPLNENSPRYRRALDIANKVLTEDKWSDLLPNNTLFFHNLTVAPRWVYKKVTTIGNHVFYSRGKEKKIDTVDSE
jgi:spore germination cell wall hydrolase CwlJ-like protein